MKWLAGRIIPCPQICAALGIALLASLAGNTVQHLSAERAAAQCLADAEKVRADIATATADAERKHAENVASIATQVGERDAAVLQKLEEATSRISGAARSYAAASKKPLPENCRADAERVAAVNKARGHTP